MIVPQPPDLADPLLSSLNAARRRHHFLPAQVGGPAPVVVAVSGGADSMCLLHALAHLQEVWCIDLHVVHVNHKLRAQADADAAFVAAAAAALHLPFHLAELDPNQLRAAPSGLEDAARRGRYARLAAAALNVTPAPGVPQIAVAHTADDQAETILLHLVQGSGLQGLGGMRWVAPCPVSPEGARQEEALRPVQIVRPLLGVTRPDVLAFLARRQVGWREDASNQNLDLLRNRLRHTVLPALRAINPALATTLGHTAAVLQDEAERSRRLDQALLAALLAEPSSEERVVVRWAGWRELPPAERRGILRAALDWLNADGRAIGFEQVESLIEQASAAASSSGPHPLAGQLAWTRTNAPPGQPVRLSLHRQDALPLAPDGPLLAPGSCDPPAPLTGKHNIACHNWKLHTEELPIALLAADWRHNPNPWQAFLDADTARSPALTAAAPGMDMQPLGMAGHKTLGDLFTDAKIPLQLRSRWPVIVSQDDGKVLWLCGLRVAQQARITPQTRRVLVLQWQPAPAIP